MQLIVYLDGCKWLEMAPLTRQACGRARAPGQGRGWPAGRPVHTGIFDQNFFHSTTYLFSPRDGKYLFLKKPNCKEHLNVYDWCADIQPDLNKYEKLYTSLWIFTVFSTLFKSG